MAEKDTSTPINLLPHEKENLMTHFLDWALTVGRLLVILTEIVALATFIYRFGLDSQIVKLHDKIKSDSFIVDNFQQAETTFRDIQARLATVKKYDAVGNTTESTFTEIAKLGKNTVTFKDLTVSTQNAKINAEAPSGAALSKFVNALKNSPLVTGVSIDKVTNDTATAQITVYITATLKPAGFATTVTKPPRRVSSIAQ